MKTVTELAREAGPLISTPFDKWCENFHDLAIAQYRESLLAVVGEPQKIEQTDQYGDAYGYTADQMAAAVAIERERCLNCYSPDDTVSDYQDKIRGQT